MICRVQQCPTLLRRTVNDLFSYRSIDYGSELSVITIVLKPDRNQFINCKETETERLAQTVRKNVDA